jgi:L-ribulose-5-phosphate 3-epimerase
LLCRQCSAEIASAEAMAAFVEAFGPARLLVAYDIANAEFIGEEQAEAIRRLQPMLAQVHLSDATLTLPLGSNPV